MAHGGKRYGAGRPVGTGKFRTATKTIRIPADMESEVLGFLGSGGESEPGIPLYTGRVAAGYPVQLASEYDADKINLHSYLIERNEDAFLVIANGQSMINAGINDGDILVVNSKKQAKEGDIVVASLNGEFTVKKLSRKKGLLSFLPENPEFKPIIARENDDVKIFGVVSHSIHKMQ